MQPQNDLLNIRGPNLIKFRLPKSRWDQMDLNRGRMHVNRLKNGDPSVHFLEGDENRVVAAKASDVYKRQLSELADIVEAK